MSDKYDSKNGYVTSDFKRISKEESEEMEQEGQDGVKINEKADEYMREILSEKIKLNSSKFPITTRLIDQEVAKVQASGRIPANQNKYVDVFREKPVKISVRVLVPVKEHPKFNFVGKLLGPKGNTMKLLQEDTMCKMAILGRGSMRDRQKEEELRNSLDPKYAHLSDELHVEISALAPPAEAHARIAYALAEVKKYLIPESSDSYRPAHMRELMERDYSGHGVSSHAASSRMAMGRSGRLPPPPPHRAMPVKTKVISILDRARSAMETSYSGYDDPYGAPEPHVRGPPQRAPEPDYYYERSHDRYYDDEPYYKPEESREYKTTAREVGTRRPPQRHAARSAPYPPQRNK